MTTLLKENASTGAVKFMIPPGVRGCDNRANVRLLLLDKGTQDITLKRVVNTYFEESLRLRVR